MKRKIHIIGGPGSGKTFIANALSEKLGIPHLDLDDIFWDNLSGYGNKANEVLRNKKLDCFVDQSGWVIEGIYYQWLSRSFQRADLIVILLTPVWLRHWRVVRRYISRKLGREYSKGESLRSLIELLKYNHAFDAGQMQRARKAMPEHDDRILITHDLKIILEAL